MEKGGLRAALEKAGLTAGSQVRQVDEMRLGLQGQTRKVWASRGVKVVQKVQFVFEWTYLLLGVNPLTGALQWDWLESMRQEHLVPALQEWPVDGVVWDRASSHRGKQTGELPIARIFQPSYSPELNPVERIFQELRRKIEGQIYDSLAAKQQAVEKILQELAADPDRVKRLVSWDWIRVAFDDLPAP